MSQVAQYLLSIFASTFAVSIISIIPCHKSSLSSIIKVTCGLFLAITVISPLLNIQVSIPNDLLTSISVDSSVITASAAETAYDAKASIIIEQVTAYILEKANALHLNVDVEIILSNDDIPVPKQVYLRGTAGPFAKQQLTSYIADNIGIQEENQIWI